MMVIGVIAAVVTGVFLVTVLVGAPYVPTHQSQAQRAFGELRPLTRRDVVLDIGSGDGVVLRAAVAAGAGRVVGYEINPLLVLITKLRLRKIRKNSKVVLADFWRKPFPSDTTIVYTFGETRDIQRMYARVQSEATRLGREIDFISYAFRVPGQQHIAQAGAHYLYRLSPLHSS